MNAVTRIDCPLCEWHHEEPPLTEVQTDPMTLDSVFGRGVMALQNVNHRAERIERALEAHFKTHTTVEWLRKVQTLNGRLAKTLGWLQHWHQCPCGREEPLPDDICACGLTAFITDMLAP